MTSEQLGSVLGFLTILFMAWVFWYYCWQRHRVDVFRQDLFDIRDDLFSYAAAGNIEFSNPAYFGLRMVINSLIRFGHRVTFWRALMDIIGQEMAPHPLYGEKYDEWHGELAGLESSEVKVSLEEFHHRTAKAIAKQMVFLSPTLMLMTATLVVYYISRKTVEDIFADHKRLSQSIEKQSVVFAEG